MTRLPSMPLAASSAALAAVLTLIATANGAGLTPDSAAYLASGYNLATGSGLRIYTGHVLTVFPPGLAIIAAFGEWMGVGGEQAVRVFNASSFAGAVLLGFVLLKRHVRSERLVVLFTLVLAVGLPLLSVASMVYSEPAFVVACLAFILALERVGVRDSPYPSLLAAAILVWVSFLFRYAGLALIPAGALAVLLLLGPQGWGAAIRASAAFTAVASTTPLAWMLRNLRIDGTLMGARGPSMQSLEDMVVRYVTTVGHWSLPPPTPWRVQQLAGSALLLGLLGWVLLSVVRHHRAGDRTSFLERHGEVLPISCVVVVYSVYLAAASLTTALDPIDGRLLSPIYVPLLVLAARAGEGFRQEVPGRLQTRLSPAVLVLLSLFALGQGFASVHWVKWYARAGVGFASETWQSSSLIGASSELPSHATLFSNFPDATWAVSPGRFVQWVPRAPGDPPLTGDPLPTLPEFLHAVSCSESYLIWFDEPRPGLRSLAELQGHAQLTSVSHHIDGTLYWIRVPSPIIESSHVFSSDTQSPRTTCARRNAFPG